MKTSEIKRIISKIAAATREPEKKTSGETKLVIFELDKKKHALRISDLQEIVKMTDITPIPNAPEPIRGIFSLRGKMVVIVDLVSQLHIKREHPPAGGPQHIIVTEVGENIFGVIVDRVTEVLRAPITTIQSKPSLVSSKIPTKYWKGVAVLGKSKSLILLDLPKMLQDKEILQHTKT